jgi:hypothetical protein
MNWWICNLLIWITQKFVFFALTSINVQRKEDVKMCGYCERFICPLIGESRRKSSNCGVNLGGCRKSLRAIVQLRLTGWRTRSEDVTGEAWIWMLISLASIYRTWTLREREAEREKVRERETEKGMKNDFESLWSNGLFNSSLRWKVWRFWRKLNCRLDKKTSFKLFRTVSILWITTRNTQHTDTHVYKFVQSIPWKNHKTK